MVRQETMVRSAAIEEKERMVVVTTKAHYMTSRARRLSCCFSQKYAGRFPKRKRPLKAAVRYSQMANAYTLAKHTRATP